MAPACPQTIARIAAEEASRADIALVEILGVSAKRRHSRPRQRAWVRIVTETGCTVSGLAAAWGCDRKSIQRALADRTRIFASPPCLALSESQPQ